MIAPAFDCEAFKRNYSRFEAFECDDISLRWHSVGFLFPLNFCFESEEVKRYVWGLLTAHMLYIHQSAESAEGRELESSFNAGNIVTSSRAGDTAVTYQNMDFNPGDELWERFLKKTPWGKEALLIIQRPIYTDCVYVSTGCLGGGVL